MNIMTEVKPEVVNLISADLRRAMTFAGLIVERRTTIPILSAAMLKVEDDRAHLSVTDLDVQFDMIMSARASAPLSLVVNAKALARIAAVGSDEIKVERGSIHHAGRRDPTACLTFTDGSMTVRLNDFLQAEDFPTTFSNVPQGSGVEIPEATLRRALSSLAACMSTEETRYYLKGIFMTMHPKTGAMRLVSTDAHWMGIYDLADTGGLADAIIPRKAIKVMMRMLRADGNRSVAVSRHKVGDNAGFVRFACDDWTVTTKVIDGNFPDYSCVLPKGVETRKATISRKMVRRAMIMTEISSDRFCTARIDFDRKLLSMQNSDEGAIEIPCRVEAVGSVSLDPVAGFNIRYLNAIFLVSRSETIELIGVGDRPSRDPWFFATDDAALTGVIMPMRV